MDDRFSRLLVEDKSTKADSEDEVITPYFISSDRNNYFGYFYDQILLKNKYRHKYSVNKLKEINGRKKYLQSFSCSSYDVYSNLLEQTLPGFEEEGFGFETPVYCSKFGDGPNTKSILCLGFENGCISIQKIRKSKKSDEIIIKNAHKNAVYDVTWVAQENSILSASADCVVTLWQLTNEDFIKVHNFQSHSMSVKSISSNPWDKHVFASGDVDSRIIIWDTRCSSNKKANEIPMSHTYQRSYLRQPVTNAITGLLFNEEFNIVSAGASDGIIKIWDLRKTYSVGKRLPQSLWDLNLPTDSSCPGLTCLNISPYKERLYVSCLNGRIYCYHITKPTIYPVAVYFGFTKFDFHCKSCISPCGSYLLSGSGNEGAYIWLTDTPGCPIASLSGHNNIVTTVAWSEDDMLVTCDDDQYRIFKCNNISEDGLKKMEDVVGFAQPVEKCVFKESLLYTTGTEAAKCTTHGLELTKDTYDELKRKFYYRYSTHLSPRTCMTPSHSKPQPKLEKTPKTGEKGTLLSWLSSSKKTPNSDLLNVTPKSKTPSKALISKRRLAELMENNQENINNEDKKPSLSPSKNILRERENHSSTIAKMLTYDNLEKTKKFKLESSGNLSEDDFELISDATPLENSDFSRLKVESVLTEEQKFHPNESATTPVRHSSIISGTTSSHVSPINGYLLSSPTSNLPNYVIDGRSPHDRGESPKIRKREVDWLTTLRKEKNNSAKEMENKNKIEKKKSNITPNCKRRKKN